MIDLWNKDRFIYNLEYRVVDMLDEYQRTGKIEITTNAEGICLEKARLYDLLDYITKKLKIDKSKVVIHSANHLEKHPEYTIVYYDMLLWIERTRQSLPSTYVPYKENNLKTIGCFIGKNNWNRAILSAWLYKNYNDKSMLTYHYRHEDNQKLESELTDLNFYSEEDLLLAVEFLVHHTPLVINETFNEFTIGPPYHINNNILSYYKSIFLDLVCETYIMGNSFFLTEKTLRPIAASTPFIALAPIGYLKNLKALGFKTFDRWWDESYDHCEGIHRIKEIKKILEDVFTWPQEKLVDTLNEMKDTLEHNREVFLNYDNKK